MGLLYLDATRNYSDPASTSYKYFRADGQWAAPDTSHKFLDATGQYSVPELGFLAPFTLNGIDAAKCTYANRGQNGIWIDPSWTESGRSYAVYSDENILLAASGNADMYINGNFGFCKENGSYGTSGSGQGWKLATQQEYDSDPEGKYMSLDKAINQDGYNGTCCFNDKNQTTYVELSPDKMPSGQSGKTQIKLAFCKATPPGFVLFDMLIQNT